ncbi:MAG: thiamine pyrophosphate-dependent dehydrogenase E1 component subunit alpha [Nitrososphaeria archaeon]
MDIDEDLLKKMLKTMMKIRAFEEKAEDLFMKGLVHGTMHLSIGEEAVATGTILAIKEQDYITSTHRGHGHMIAKGGNLKKMFSEFLGKASGYCYGLGGSMHIADATLSHLGATGIVSSGIPIGVGAALAIKKLNKDNIVVTFFGDGASNEGLFYESVNMAAIWDLPIIFLCENNQYAMSASVKKFIPTANISDKAKAFNIKGITIDGMDVLEVYETVYNAAQEVRLTKKPVLIEAVTYRYKGHSKSDLNLYRTKDEIDEWMKRDPINNLKRKMKDMNILTDEEIALMENEINSEIKEAVDFAINSPEPTLEKALSFIYYRKEDAG